MTGNGKSATANTILQEDAFVSDADSSGVTRTCEMRTTVLENGQTLNVIDTPGLFDCSTKTESTFKEIAKCIKMAQDGIHARMLLQSPLIALAERVVEEEGGYQPAKVVPKEKSEYTAEDISSIAKDAKVRHLLHSAIDNGMSNRVINCKTAKEIWDALETRCQGTDSIKKNRKTILTQEYEHFDSKPDESLTSLYDIFVKLLNDLSLVDTEYDLEDSNLKFLSMRNGGKSMTVSLKAEKESPKAATSRKGKGKALITKSDTESSSFDSDDESETESLPEMDADEEMMKLCALMVKGITKIAYRKFRKGKKSSRKSASSDKKSFRKSEGKGGMSD
ncbi:hypothetical protein AgCh_022966 [Apium graveolens]